MICNYLIFYSFCFLAKTLSRKGYLWLFDFLFILFFDFWQYHSEILESGVKVISLVFIFLKNTMVVASWLLLFLEDGWWKSLLISECDSSLRRNDKTRLNCLWRGKFTAYFKISFRKSGYKKPITWHWLHYSFATHLLENGTAIWYIQELLGHTTSKTNEIYTHGSIKSLRQIKSPFDDL